MKKTSLLTLLLKLFFFVFFNVVFFILYGARHNFAVWVLYVFVNLSYAAFVLTSLAVHKSAGRRILGLTAHGVSFFYFVSACAVGAVCAFVREASFIFGLSAQLALLFLYLFLFVAVHIFNTKAAETEAIGALNVRYKKENEHALYEMIERTTDARARAVLFEAYDLMKAGPAGSRLTTIGIETR
jgi:hypothetical protein